MKVEMSWVEVDEAGWGWVHGLVIPLLNREEEKMQGLSSVHNFKTFLRHAEIFFPFLRYFLTGAKIIPP